MFVYGATLGFASLGLFCDLLLRGKALYVLVTFFISLETIILVVTTIFWNASGKDLSKTQSLVLYAMQGYVETITKILQLVVIPIVIAGKYRDQVDINSMPLAAQILGIVQVVCIIVPITIAVLIDGIFDLISGQHFIIGGCASILLLVSSIIPIWKTFKKELQELRLRFKKKESTSINVDYVDFYNDNTSLIRNRPKDPSMIEDTVSKQSSDNTSSQFQSLIE